MQTPLRAVTVHLGVALSILGVFLIAAVAVWLGRRLLAKALAGLRVEAEHRGLVDARARQALRVLKLTVYGAAAVASMSWALSEFGIGTPAWRPRDLVTWSLTHGLRIAAILAGSYITLRVAALVIGQVEFESARSRAGGPDPDRHRRAATISGIVSRLASIVIWLIAGLMVLRELSIDVMPILTGAGIAGLAFGLGAQALVRDVIAGFFMILEDQVRIGDAVRVNGVAGTVEQINLRTTVLRDVEGAVHVFANGTIATLSNSSKDYAYAVVEVVVALDADLDRTAEAFRGIGAAMQGDPAWGPALLGPLALMGVEKISAAGVTVRARVKTLPGRQGEIAGELRRRLLSEIGPQHLTRARSAGSTRHE
jgi:moderate conductance mechanosensitive channel